MSVFAIHWLRLALTAVALAAATVAWPEVRKATLTINLTPRGERQGVSKQQVESELREALVQIAGARVKVGSAAIADTLRIATAGDYEQALPKLNLSQRQVPVLVKLADAARGDLDLLAKLPVPGARGPVPLGNVATLTLDSGPAEIDRYDRLRNINFEIELNQQPLGEVQERALASQAGGRGSSRHTGGIRCAVLTR